MKLNILYKIIPHCFGSPLKLNDQIRRQVNEKLIYRLLITYIATQVFFYKYIFLVGICRETCLKRCLYRYSQASGVLSICEYFLLPCIIDALQIKIPRKFCRKKSGKPSFFFSNYLLLLLLSSLLLLLLLLFYELCKEIGI